MAVKRISKDQLIEQGAIEGIIQDMTKLEEVLKQILKTNQEILKANPFKTGADVQAFNKATASVKSTEEALSKVKQARIKEEEKLKQLRTTEADKLAEVKILTQEQTKINKQLARENLGLVGAYEKQAKKLVELRKRYKDVALSQGESSKAAQNLRKRVVELDERLKRVDASVGQFQRNVGNYSSAFKRLGGAVRTTLGAFGVTTGIFAFATAIRNAASTIANFQQSNAQLAGVLNTNREGVQALTKDAERLGAITAKSASEVTKLQIAYARLGFSQEEILNLTEGTIAGSIALNAELDETAELVGAVVRTFDDLETQDSGKILDVLTVSTQKSALNFEKLQTALPIVAGAANAAGIRFNTLVALLGKLSDAGIDASSSATALRNIFIESAAQGLSYEDILDKISNSTDKLTASNDEFGKRAAVSASIIANNISKTKELEEALNNAGGAAQRVADVQLDTLNGQLTLLSSAWEGFILSIESGDGVLAKTIRGAIELTTSLLTNLKDLSQTAADVAEDSAGQIQKEVDALTAKEELRFKKIRILREEISKTQESLQKLEEAKPTVFDFFLNPAKARRDGKTLEVLQEKQLLRIELLKKAIADITANTGEATNESEENTEAIETSTEAVESNTKAWQENNDIIDDTLRNYRKLAQESSNIFKAFDEGRAELDIPEIEDPFGRLFDAEEEVAEEADVLIAKYRRLKELQAELIDKTLEFLPQIGRVLDEQDRKEQQLLDNRLNRAEENIDQQQRLAERGLANTLAFEQQKAAKLEAERERLAKRAEKRQKTLAYLTAFTEYLKQDPNSAAGKALAQVAIAETVSGFFHEGTEEVGKDGGTKWRNTGKDDYLVAVHKGERIMTAEQNRMVGDLSNEDLANIAYYHRTQGVAPSFSSATFSDNQLQKLSKSIAKSIDISIDTEGFVTRKEFEAGIRKIVKFKPSRRI